MGFDTAFGIGSWLLRSDSTPHNINCHNINQIHQRTFTSSVRLRAVEHSLDWLKGSILWTTLMQPVMLCHLVSWQTPQRCIKWFLLLALSSHTHSPHAVPTAASIYGGKKTTLLLIFNKAFTNMKYRGLDNVFDVLSIIVLSSSSKRAVRWDGGQSLPQSPTECMLPQPKACYMFHSTHSSIRGNPSCSAPPALIESLVRLGMNDFKLISSQTPPLRRCVLLCFSLGAHYMSAACLMRTS